MPVNNNEIAKIFREYADLLSIKGANQFKIRAYREAASNIENTSKDLRSMIENDMDLQSLDGIGEGIAKKIEEIVESKELSHLKELKKKIPEGLLEVMKLDGLGPERVKKLYKELDIKNLEDLERAIELNKIQNLSGFGKKTEQNIKDSLERSKNREKRLLYAEAEEYVKPLVKYLKDCKEIDKLEVAGSFRRKKQTIGDIDILVSGDDRDIIMDYFTNYEDVEKILAKGETKSSVILRSDLQIDLRLVDEKNFGAALIYFTGSKQHNIRIRNLGKKNNYKINEYGVIDDVTDEIVSGEKENKVYKSLNLPFIVPELREDRGEVEAGLDDELPDLVKLSDIKGDLQMHSTFSDGKATITEMAKVAREIGHEYIAITDHSKQVTVANGMDAEELADQIEKVKQVNKNIEGIEILKSIEVDILEDGSLDLPNSILKELDIRICCIHSKFKLPQKKQTRRILKAMENPYFNILGHPTAREINKRRPIQIDIDKIMDKAIEQGCYLELNSSPRRLDLNDKHCKKAKSKGLKIAISTDSHRTNQLYNIKYGINQARRGWLETEDIITTYSLKKLKDIIER